MNETLYKIAITHGDLNGISYEVILKALSDNKMTELCSPIVYGLAKVASFYKNRLGMQEPGLQVVKSIEQISLKKNNLLNIVEQEVQINVGKSEAVAGKMSELALQAVCRDLKAGKVDAVVTAPINKDNIQSDTFRFHGHTEFFAQQFDAPESMMMMVTEGCRIGFVTNHLPVAEVAKAINVELILKKLRILHKTLRVDFGCSTPKIAVLSLNPHAGDNGLLGKEEKEVIIPAINQAFAEKINAFGPFPADGLFGSGNYAKYDAVLAMYHDEGMIPFKILSRGEGVNFTAGLPIVRTSPAHGTAYDIAGQNKADGQSMRNAIYLAIDILRNRQNFADNAK
ncbi:MAG: 4-hydroxythreonine-4-phosphate dehydrogenase PdxA [Bacteroidales bacterium]|nr:4-hydroxythreonine-4-phosphate dehydrogenase PdxA [Bacteroidales bacterium]